MKNTVHIISVILLILSVSCSREKSGYSNYTATNDIKYSSLLRISENKGNKLVRILSPSDSTKTLATYLLVPRNEKVRENRKDVQILHVPLNKIVVYSSVHASVLEELGATEIVKGVADAQFFKLDFIKKGIETGEITDIGQSSSPSMEKLIHLSPECVMISLYEGMTVPDFSSSGIVYLKLADNLETSPLGRAEWIKFIGLLTGEELKADSIFRTVEKNYLTLKQKAYNAKSRPKVITDNIYQGIWYVPGGRSYQARMIEDAGGIYPWNDNKDTGSLSLAFEEVYAKASDADIWLYKGFGIEPTCDAVVSTDPRHGKINALYNGGLWICDTSSSSLFEDFPFHPDLLLEEYLTIFHPELNKGKSTRYFTKAIQK